jgi:hypothetical protein
MATSSQNPKIFGENGFEPEFHAPAQHRFRALSQSPHVALLRICRFSGQKPQDRFHPDYAFCRYIPQTE